MTTALKIIENPDFILKNFVDDSIQNKRTIVFSPKTVRDFPHIGLTTDFANIFVGTEPSQEDLELFGIDKGTITIIVPSEWRWPQLAKMLGMFDSSTQASKNGWNKDIPKGFSQEEVRINKIRGIVTILNL